jgi:hypothetical protein
MLTRTLLAAVATLALVGCTDGKTRIKVTEVKRQRLELALPEPITFDRVQWVVVNEANFAKVMADMRARGEKPILFALTADGVKRMKLNEAKVAQLVKRYRTVTLAYRDYYENQ